MPFEERKGVIDGLCDKLVLVYFLLVSRLSILLGVVNGKTDMPIFRS